MPPTITAFEPDHGEGQARDMRIRWAHEEVGPPTDVRIVSFNAMKWPAERTFQSTWRCPIARRRIQRQRRGHMAALPAGLDALEPRTHHRLDRGDGPVHLCDFCSVIG